MAVPKRKTSKGKRNQRRSHHALKKMNIAFDATTGEPKLSHHISLKDGYYNGKVMLKKASKTNTSADETDAAV
ncbi:MULTISPECIES: 50S ribosomal protein L32 [unclassified Candidatus Lariskella]|uniref:50S ribosomal protein L32 n=1 Tax=unclassified Candidatus Lariskella TaxID=2632605 RepID=UPI0030CC9665